MVSLGEKWEKIVVFKLFKPVAHVNTTYLDFHCVDHLSIMQLCK